LHLLLQDEDVFMRRTRILKNRGMDDFAAARQVPSSFHRGCCTILSAYMLALKNALRACTLLPGAPCMPGSRTGNQE
jgi:hypothetical protein